MSATDKLSSRNQERSTVKPILFSAPMVRALWDKRKTQTRRLLKPQPPTDEQFLGSSFGLVRRVAASVGLYSLNDVDRLPKHPTQWELCGSVGVARKAGFPMVYDARFAIGDQLWVRETWAVGNIYDGVKPRSINPGGKPGWCGIRYAATDARLGIRDRAAIHMPRWASRLTLAVTDVQVQRLQDISEADAIAEGTQEPTVRELGGDLAQAAWSERQVYSRLWNSIHGPAAWAANPWVVATTFEAQRRNVDEAEPEVVDEAPLWEDVA